MTTTRSASVAPIDFRDRRKRKTVVCVCVYVRVCVYVCVCVLRAARLTLIVGRSCVREPVFVI